MEEEAVDVENFRHKCVECGKTYANASNLNHHARLKHAVDETATINLKSLRCPLCEIFFRSYKAVNEHLQGQHQVELVKDHLEFPSLEEFSNWKLATEVRDKCMYVKKCGSKVRNGVKRTLYYCHRSGVQSSKSIGLRRMRLQGSVRMNATCPSWMKVEEKDSKVRVEFIKTHVGHSNEANAV